RRAEVGAGAGGHRVTRAHAAARGVGGCGKIPFPPGPAGARGGPARRCPSDLGGRTFLFALLHGAELPVCSTSSEGRTVSPTLDAFLRSWPFEPWLLVVLLLSAWVYWRGWRVLNRRAPERWHSGRLGAFLGRRAAGVL